MAGLGTRTLGLAVGALSLLPCSAARAQSSGAAAGGTAPRGSQPTAFAVHGLAARGTARHIGLAGATLALPVNDMAPFENPAALVFDPTLFSIGLSSATSSDFKPLLGETAHPRADSTLAGVSARPVSMLGLAGAYDRIIFANDRALTPRTAVGTRVSRSSFPVSLGVRILRQVSLGVSASWRRASVERLSGERGPLDTAVVEQTFKGMGWRLAAMGALNERMSVALAYEPPASLKSESVSANATNVLADEILEPGRVQFGAGYLLALGGQGAPLPFEHVFLVQLDALFLDDRSGAPVISPAGLTLEGNVRALGFANDMVRDDARIRYRDARRYVPRLGVESTWWRTGDFAALTWCGAYQEPATFAQDADVTHLTVGAELTAWFLMAHVAFDFGKKGANRVYGVGVSMR